MDWVKKNYDQFLLAVIALVLLAFSIILIRDSLAFREVFAGIRGQITPNNNVPPIDPTSLDQAQGKEQKPANWAPRRGSLLVSRKYLVKDNKLVDPLAEGGGPSDMIHPPVPNSWLVDNNLEMLDPNVLEDDPDSDGFSNLDEFNGKTDPQNKDSHPPYVTKLRLRKFLKVPFRLILQTADAGTFQINTLDVRQPSQFVKEGDPIAGTKFKVLKFTPKKVVEENGFERDISELAIQNTETGAQVVLVMEKIVNSPDSFALFKYLWDGSEIRVKKDQTFALKPELDVQYKLIDIQEHEATIENLRTGEKPKVPPLEQIKR
ncbi:MAG: hypothetical protein M3O82_01120 [Verrucomicrobiota bacterium]|nr:hypothetical protein [Verrucomicrobiota bacterium]